MTSENTYRYLTQLTAEGCMRKRDPRYPTFRELLDFIKKYEEVTVEEVKKHLNTLYKEGKVRERETINGNLIEIL